MQKQEIVRELGGSELLLPDEIARSLTANDQVKYYFALLQTARSNADRPREPVADLKAERLASRLDDAWLDDVVAGTKKDAGGRYRIPHAPEILRRIAAAIDGMLACLPEAQREPFARRLAALPLPAAEHGALSGEAIDAMTSGNRKAGDSLHLVVMDAHRAINSLQVSCAAETLAGAYVYNLSPRGRMLAGAFMDGLNRTAPLKFDHPGLGTTALEHGGRLLIQNDIGTTGAHVLVLRVEGCSAAVTYTDVHEERLRFFQRMLAPFEVRWEDASPRTGERPETGSYLLTTGTFDAPGDAALARYLEHLASRIVFLIDWNRARKRLHLFVDKAEAVALLDWAAANDFGHRGLLEIGGERALAEAIEYAAAGRLRYGDRLQDLIGPENTQAFLRHALRTASAGLRQRRSRRAILDEIKANLRRYFETARLAIFDLAAEHAALGYDLAVTLRETFSDLGGLDAARAGALMKRAGEWEAAADRVLNAARDDVRRFERPHSLLVFFECADDAVDEMEEAASLLDLLLLPGGEHLPLAELSAQADLVLRSAQEFVKCVECAATITRADVRDDLDGFLQCLERLMDIEHRADDQLRATRRALLAKCRDPRALLLVHQVSGVLETVTDAHNHAGQALRGYLMEEVLA